MQKYPRTFWKGRVIRRRTFLSYIKPQYRPTRIKTVCNWHKTSWLEQNKQFGKLPFFTDNGFEYEGAWQTPGEGTDSEHLIILWKQNWDRQTFQLLLYAQMSSRRITYLTDLNEATTSRKTLRVIYIFRWGNTLEPESANFFCKGPEGKYFHLGRPYGLCCNSSALPLCCESIQRQHVNKWLWLCANKTLFTKTDGGKIWLSSHSFLILVLEG